MKLRFMLLAALLVATFALLIAQLGENAAAQSTAAVPTANRIATPAEPATAEPSGFDEEPQASPLPFAPPTAPGAEGFNQLRTQTAELFKSGQISERERKAIDERIDVEEADYLSGRPPTLHDARARQQTAGDMLAFWRTASDLSSTLSSPQQDRWTIQEKLQVARELLSRARNDEQMARASELLRGTLDKYFEADIQTRRGELEDIKARVAEMEAHLAKRIAAKDQIVDLQLQTFVNEAEGLGFFTEPANMDGQISGGGPGF